MKKFPFTNPLRKHVRYPTYQLFATMDNRKTSPRDGLTLGALTTLHWLAERLDEDVPEQLQNLPPLENFRTIAPESLESFRLAEDFNVTVVTSPKRGVWTMQITEPDLGSDPNNPNQKRPPSPGRFFETNISFRIVKNELLCGFQTVVREPTGASPAPDVYRLAVVSALISNPDFGLRQIVRIGETPLELKTGVDVERFLSMRRSKENQLPLVVFVRGSSSPTEDFSDLLNAAPSEAQDKKSPFSDVEISRPKKWTLFRSPKLPEGFLASLLHLSKKKEEVIKSSPDQKRSAVPYSEPVKDEGETEVLDQPDSDERTIAAANDFAQHLRSFCLTFLLEAPLAGKLGRSLNRQVSAGDVLLFEPAGFGGAISLISGTLNEEKREAELKNLREFVHNYLRRKPVRFAGINFVSSLRERLFARSMRRLKRLRPRRLNLKWLNPRRLNLKKLSLKKLSLRKFNPKNFPGVRKNRVDAAQVKQLQADLARKNDEITAREEKLVLLRSDLSSKDAEIAKQRAAIDDLKKSHAAALAAKDDLIDYLRDRMTWPESHDEIADWAEEKLKGKLVLVQHAKDLLLQKGAQSADVGQICEALHYLATDYRDVRYKFISEDEGNMRTSAKYNRTYIINPTSDTTIREHPEQYRVKYALAGNKNLVDCDLTSHLRIGHSAARLVRIYYFHDDDRKLIVVGSLPQHLKNAGE